jgi:hypothetical protein
LYCDSFYVKEETQKPFFSMPGISYRSRQILVTFKKRRARIPYKTKE